MEPSQAAAFPVLSDEQRQTIHRAASELLSAAVLNLPAKLANRDLAGAGGIPVIGAFISVKRQGRLRSCCGFLEETANVADAVEKSALRTATDDARFPRISPLELPYLDVETWLLHSPRRVTEVGHDRAKAVEIGKHGVQVRGNNRGLLLPGVATEAKFTPEQFLQQVCMKAGLPPSLWVEEETQMWTFEGVEFGGPIEAAAAKKGAITPGVPFPDEVLQRIAKACAYNIFLLYRGATASYILPGCPDGNVAGLALFVNEPMSQETLEISKMSMQPLMPLQSSLFALCQGAAGRALQQRAKPGMTPQSINLALAILFDPSMHGTVEKADVRGIDPARRVVLVAEGQNNAWIYDPDKSTEQLVTDAAKLAKVVTPESAGIFSLGICSTAKPLAVIRTVEAQPGPAVRAANLAGKFYPADAAELNTVLDKLLAGDAPAPEAWPAVMVPHAGLQYSGKVAADALRRVKIPSTVIVICPKHTPLGVEWAVAPNETWRVPTGTVANDLELAKQLAAAIPGLELDGAAHHLEHAIEVELPLIHRLAPHAKVVGIAIGGGKYERLEKFAEGLASVLADRQGDTLLVISSDMNHFATDDENRKLDETALVALETLDPHAAFDTIMDKRISMCGLRPATIVMETLKRWNKLHKSVRTGYATTADATGDKARVVGYAGMLLG